MARGLSVLALVTDAFGGYGGIAQYNRDFFQSLSDSDLVERIEVLPRIAGEAFGRPPLKVRQCKPRIGRFSYALNAIATARSRGPFDLVFCGHIYHAPLSAAIQKMFGGRLWIQTHGVDAWTPPGLLACAAVRHADVIATVSRYTRRKLLEWAEVCPERVRVLPNTVRPIFSPGPRSEETLAKFGLSNRKVILTVARLSRADIYKGHSRVIEAMARVRLAEPKAVYVIVGDGDGRADIEALAARLELRDAVRLVGKVDDVDLLSLYRSADAFIMPSTKEGFGIVFVEAAAAGLPVIAGNRDGSVDALADGAIGRLIDPMSIDEIGGALLDVLHGRAPIDPHAAQRFSYPNFASHVDALLRTLA
ncbi:glycosyltransferase family 4 protein [Methylocystis sp. WRRC1]|uniref:glycosyltransferase family 4 protein n=1 Tax=Methylocystis sp. WRRC1 TaxID=1732014 RepID=UPI001D147D16|nr:glycosyltransferase family 4 protein [Methylocystis sp. WRRC1]MCC3244471.1 glycosyltransferase family 4 protein [Methylocystis sp. WRRC1]